MYASSATAFPSRLAPKRTHWRTQLATVWLLAMPVLWTLGPGGLDRHIAHAIYAWSGYAWNLKHAWLAEVVLHDIGRSLVIGFAVLAAARLGWVRRQRSLNAAENQLLFVVAALAMSTLVVSSLKQIVPAQCPWDQLDFGGRQTGAGWWQWGGALETQKHCFPAGHASAGYGLLGLGFVAQFGRWRWIGWAFPLITGLMFGLDQQLRGAHFLSHDIVTLLTCWSVALVLWQVWGRRRCAPGSLRFGECEAGSSP